MAARPVIFHQADLARAFKAAAKAGQQVRRVEIEPSGKIVLIFDAPGQEDTPNPTEWDEPS